MTPTLTRGGPREWARAGSGSRGLTLLELAAVAAAIAFLGTLMAVKLKVAAERRAQARAPAAAPAAPAAPVVEEGDKALLPQPGTMGQPVFISQGRIAVLEILQFLADFEGLPVLYDSSDRTFTLNDIRVPCDLPGADGEVARALLDAHCLRVFHEILSPGRQVLHVVSMGAAGPASDGPLHRMEVILQSAEHSARSSGYHRRTPGLPWNGKGAF